MLSPAQPGQPDLPPFLQAAMQELWRTALTAAASATGIAPPDGAPVAAPGSMAAPVPELIAMYRSQLDNERTFNQGLIGQLSKKEESLKHLRKEYGTKVDLLTVANREKTKQVTSLEKTVKSLETENAAARQRAEDATTEAATLRGQVAALQAELDRLRQ